MLADCHLLGIKLSVDNYNVRVQKYFLLKRWVVIVGGREMESVVRCYL